MDRALTEVRNASGFSSLLEKILFVKVEAWVLIGIVLLGMIATVLFGYVVHHTATGGTKAGVIGNVAVAIAKFPALVKQIVDNPSEVDNRFPDISGFSKNPRYEAIKQDRILLMSRYDGDTAKNVAEIVNTADESVLHAWIFDPPEKFQYDLRDAHQVAVTSDPSTMRVPHPLVSQDLDLTFHFPMSPLYQLDACSNLLWLNDEFGFHHSVEEDGAGNYWVPGTRQTKLDGFDKKYKDDHIVQVNKKGETIFAKSVTEILMENDLINRIYRYDKHILDPVHLNDIQPVMVSTDYWKKGDLFISIGHLNMLMHYRPSENKLLSWSQDRMMHQHDVDIIDEHKIALFDNRSTMRARDRVVIGYNDILVFDLKDKSVSSPYSEIMKVNDIRTINQGLFTITRDNHLFIEETNYGRLLLFHINGDKIWEYVNKASGGKAYTLNWSTLLPNESGTEIVKKLAVKSCENS